MSRTDSFQPSPKAYEKIAGPSPRIALLTPYAGGNLGDAAIQDAIIANLRSRLPQAQFSGITLNCDNFIERHGVAAFPLSGTDRRFYGMSRGSLAGQVLEMASALKTPGRQDRESWSNLLKTMLKHVPGLARSTKLARATVATIAGERRHWIEGYRFLRSQDLLIVSGGGQLDDEWGGAWGHPFALFKWAVLARIAGVPYAIASVGACKITSTTSRLFLAAALRLACYRSYRDKSSRDIAASLLERAALDPVVPDLAFGMPSSELPRHRDIATSGESSRIIAISPIAYAKPGRWPSPDRALYERYLTEMAKLVLQLLLRGDSLIIVWSSLGDDESVIAELLARLDETSRELPSRQLRIPIIGTWRDFAAALTTADFLIASRLHGAILGVMNEVPTIVISFDPKVDWLVRDLEQTDYLLQIRDFTAKDVLDALDRIERHRDTVLKKIADYRDRIMPVTAQQYGALAKLATASRRLS